MTPLRTLRALSIALALMLMLGPPIALLVHQWQYEDATIRTEAEINARLFAEVINRTPDLWQFQTDKLEALLSRRSNYGSAEETRRILSLNQELIAESRSDLPAPRISAREPLLDAGTPVAWLEIERSLRPALLDSLGSLLVCTLLGLAVYQLLARIPLKALAGAVDQLNAERDKALLTLRSIGDAVVTTDALGRVESLNPVAEQFSGWSSEAARGRPIAEVLHCVRVGTRDALASPVDTCLRTLSRAELGEPTVLIHRGDGSERHIEESAAPIIGRRGQLLGAILVFHDVSERVRAEQRLQHTAFHDALTGLPNRDLFRRQLQTALETPGADPRRLAVLFLDLDRFKAINDSLGHSIGDALLVLTAKRVRRCVRDGDLVCRLGGDEFTVLLAGIDSADTALAVAAKILASLARPFHIEQHQMRVSASVGVALYPEHGDSVEALLKNADTAMYQAKTLGRNNAQLYTPIMNAAAGEHLRRAFALQEALERDEFRLEFQPKLRARDQQVVGVEALLRWDSLEFGRVSPAVFVPQLEESGGIVAVGRWVLQTAVRQAQAWAEAGRPLSVAVNVSAVQFGHDSLVADIADLLRETGLPPPLLEIELTESLLMVDMQRSQRVMAALRALGVKLSLDDFGTGFSSLGYLRRFAVDELKIDRSFVQEMDSDATASRIVKTVIELGQTLGMRVVAEGVETAAQAQALSELGCDLLQGYWLARPMPVEALTAWLAARSP